MSFAKEESKLTKEENKLTELNISARCCGLLLLCLGRKEVSLPSATQKLAPYLLAIKNNTIRITSAAIRGQVHHTITNLP